MDAVVLVVVEVAVEVVEAMAVTEVIMVVLIEDKSFQMIIKDLKQRVI